MPGQTNPVKGINHMNAYIEGFARSRGPSAVILNSRSDAMDMIGIYKCEVPDHQNITQVLFIGVYSENSGMNA